jgi:HTH-type transcriptional regulator, sugar sensing transcriptional regulator
VKRAVAALETLLHDAGFTDYEARAYVALLKKSPQTGYELAKTSRVPRPNIYDVLNKLETRGAATRIVHPDTVRYTAVEPTTVLQKMKNSFTSMIQDMESQLKMVSADNHQTFVESFQGYDNLVAFLNGLFSQSTHEILVAVHPQEAMALESALEAAYNRNVEIRTLCLHGCTSRCAACKGEFHRPPFESQASGRWVIAIGDNQSLVAGEIHGENVLGFRTKLPLLAKIAALFIEQSMVLSGLTASGKISLGDIPNSVTIV